VAGIAQKLQTFEKKTLHRARYSIWISIIVYYVDFAECEEEMHKAAKWLQRVK
jgi:hypothetical protein